MAHRTEKEETEFKVVPDNNITLCLNCGVAANNSCQACFAEAKRSLRSSPSARPNPPPTTADLRKQEPAAPARREVSRCSGCRRKVGLTGFRCRCGEMFCADHRYSDRHDCSYDYKSAGRETIARENPVVKAAKIVRI